MSILMIGPDYNKTLGGMSTVLSNYYNNNDMISEEIIKINTTSDSNKVKKILQFIIAYIKVCFYIVFQRNIRILHIHTASRGSFIRKSKIVRLGKKFDKKVILHLHGAKFKEYYENECNTKKQLYIKNTFEMCDSIIVLGEEWKEWLKKYVNKEITVLHNSVNVPEENYYSNDSNNIVMLGRLEERKGTYDLLEVINDIVKKYENIKFVLAGDGDLERLDKKIEELKIPPKNIRVLGWIDSNERNKLLKDCLIYVLPSYNEGMPMSILEAMSYGIPCISTNVGSIPSVIENNINGIIINPGDKDSLKDSLLKLLDNEKLRAEYSVLSYRKIENEFCLQNHIQNLLKIYKM